MVFHQYVSSDVKKDDLSVQKEMLHSLHWYGFSPECILRWQSSLPLSVKALLHSVHWYGFPPVCALRCSVKAPFSVKALSHWLHWYECVLRCSAGLLIPVKALFLPVCILRYKLKWLFWIKALSHWEHWHDFVLVCILIWILRLYLWEKVLSHLYSRFPRALFLLKLVFVCYLKRLGRLFSIIALSPWFKIAFL